MTLNPSSLNFKILSPFVQMFSFQYCCHVHSQMNRIHYSIFTLDLHPWPKKLFEMLKIGYKSQNIWIVALGHLLQKFRATFVLSIVFMCTVSSTENEECSFTEVKTTTQKHVTCQSVNGTDVLEIFIHGFYLTNLQTIQDWLLSSVAWLE